MLRFAVIALCAGALGILEGLELLGLWAGGGQRLLCGLIAFAGALAYGRAMDRLGKGKGRRGQRLLFAFACFAWILLGALRLPIGSQETWKLTMGIEKELLGDGAARGALLGLLLCLPAGMKAGGQAARGRALFAFSTGALAAACLLLLFLSYGLALPGWLTDWAAPAGFLLGALAQGAAALIPARPRSGRKRQTKTREVQQNST